jgi:sulfur carrier protein ThiS
MILSIETFGAFRDFYKAGFIEIECELPIQIGTIKDLIALQNIEIPNFANLVKTSVIANETEILGDAFMIDKICQLMILPPVSGGK